MKKLLLLAVMLCAVSAQAQVSYWFQGWQRMGNAADAQSYFMMPGANVTFTYANNRVYINSLAGGGAFVPIGTGFFHATAGVEDANARLVTLIDGADMAVNQGTTITVLHGNAAGLPSWGSVNLATDVSGALPNVNLANSSLTYNGLTVALGGSGTLNLASANFVNQGTTTTLLHGNAAGNPSWGAVNLATDVTGTLPGSSVSGVWLTAGNTLGAPGTFGSLDNQPINIKVNNVATGKLDINGSVALGTTSVAAGNSAVAIGVSASAPAASSVGIGNLANCSSVSGVAIGLQSAASGAGGFATAIGPKSVSSGQYSVALGYQAQALGDSSYAIGNSAVANNAGSFVLQDSQLSNPGDTVADQFTAGFASGHYFYGFFGTPEFNIGDTLGGGDAHGAFNIIADLNLYAGVDAVAANNVYAVANVIASNNVSAHLNVIATNDAWAGHNMVATNGFFYLCQSNSVVPTNVFQPLHTWGCLMKTNTNTIVAAANTYTTITNYTLGRSNQMGCNLTGGAITNTVAGFYHCAIHLSGVAVDNSAYVEGELVLGGVARDEISFQTHFDNPPRTKGMSALGILYIPANTRITFQIRSTGANGVIVQRAQMSVVPP